MILLKNKLQSLEKTDWNFRYKTLDHWRGFAALWVMLHHGFSPIHQDNLHPIVEFFKSIC